MTEKVGRCHDCTASQTEINMLSRHILELQADKGRLTDSVRELEEKLANADYQLEGRDLEIKELEKENAELKSENKKWKDEWQEQVQKATDEGYARTLQTMQLTKAKEIIKNLMVFAEMDDREYEKEYKEAEQFLSEVEK